MEVITFSPPAGDKANRFGHICRKKIFPNIEAEFNYQVGEPLE